MTTSAQLENEADATRAQIAQTLDELRSRITPGQLVDQLVDYARDGSGGMFFRNLRDQVVSNPVPVTLMGAGLAWLMVSGRQTSDGRDRTAHLGASLRDHAAAGTSNLAETASEWGEGASSTASDLGERARSVGSRLQNTASSVTDSVSAAYDSAADRARRATDAVGTSASQLQHSAGAATRGVTEFLQEQPLVLAGIGLALGALLGAVLPSTETEDRLMGDASDAVKADAARRADEGLEKSQAAAEKAWEGAKQEIGESADHAAASADSETPEEVTGAASLVPSDEDIGSEQHSDFARRDPAHGSS